MSLHDIGNLISNDGSGWLFTIVVMMSLIQVSPIKINPWSTLVDMFRNSIVKETKEKIDAVADELVEVKSDISDINQRDFDEQLDQIRLLIIDTARELKKNNGVVNDSIDIEYLTQIIKKCDYYEKVCKEKNIPNGVANMSIQYIRQIYQQNML